MPDSDGFTVILPQTIIGMRNMKGTVRRMELVKHAYTDNRKKTVRKERVAEEQS